MTITFLLVLLIGAYHIDCVRVLHESPSSSCYGNGQAQQCKPPFSNIAEKLEPHVTSTCGQMGPEQVCRTWHPNRQYCTICHDSSMHPPSYITDRHIPHNKTCWFSGPLTQPGDSVNVTLSLRKRYEIYFVALQLCGTLPDSIAIYKSQDFGVSWKPWHLFSQDCYRAFKMPTTNEDNFQITPANLQEVLCVQLRQHSRYNDLGQAEIVIPFSTVNGRPSGHPWSEGLIDWITTTDLKVSLIRFPSDSSRISRNVPHGSIFYNPRPLRSSSSLRRENSIVHYGLSEISLGGRCKCNGHASRCLADGERVFCDCQHNTEGQDCERCRPGYLDRPWYRATRYRANACKQCECHLHSLKCKFDHQVYVSNNYESGTVCLNCQHNTEGRLCDRCRENFYRDWTKPFRHKLACISCNCHPIGSLKTNDCDQHTGQCRCKEGVTGQTCDRCKNGYKQTSSSVRPCLPIFQNKKYSGILYNEQGTNMDSMANTSPVCKKCNEKRKRIRFKKYCRRKAVFRASVQSKELHGSLIRYELRIEEQWRMHPKVWSFLPRSVPALHTYRAWITEEQVRCNCPDIQLGHSYLVLTRAKYHTYRGHPELMIDSRSVMLPWQPTWRRRMNKFLAKEREGKCQRFYGNGKRKNKQKMMEKNKKDKITRKQHFVSKKPGFIENDNNEQQKKRKKKKTKTSKKKKQTRRYNSHYGYYGSQKI